MIIAVSHNDFKTYTALDWEKLLKRKPVLLDVKGAIDVNLIRKIDENLEYWRL
ncbi:hypothetical protein [Acinetobacter soli]|uniref:hypothetical protein n=1 Tax=Acinetobacter soli TaxID=487316 RepID=UPI00148EFBE7|nr:hypothetical protein [Acinetobacter soli]